jgi:hypothetical protein
MTQEKRCNQKLNRLPLFSWSLYWLSLGLRLQITPFLLGRCIDCPCDYGFWLHFFSWVIVLTVVKKKGVIRSLIQRTVNIMTQEKRCNQKPNPKDSQYNIVLTVIGITASDYTFSLVSLYWLSLGLSFWLHLFSWVIVLTVLGITASDYTFSLGHCIDWIWSRNPKDSQYNDQEKRCNQKPQSQGQSIQWPREKM